jgi:hypothetical protein
MYKYIVVFALLTISLVACSRAPSAQDIETAIAKSQHGHLLLLQLPPIVQPSHRQIQLLSLEQTPRLELLQTLEQ